MDVGIDARYVDNELSGIGRYTLNLLRGIAEVGPECRLVVLVSGMESFPEQIKSCRCFEFVEISRNPRGLPDQAFLPGAIRRLGLGLIHSMDAFTPLLPTRAKKITTIYDLIPLTCCRQNRKSVKTRLSLIWKAWLKAQCRCADMVLTLSHYSAGDIEKLLRTPARKIRVVEGGILMPSAKPRSPNQNHDVRDRLSINGRLILYVGRRDPHKNLIGLIRSFARVRAAYAGQATLVIVGAYDPRYPEPEEEVRQLGLNDSVVFTGYLSDETLAALYRAASVFVFPSLYEGFGLPPLEAMSHGAPVVSSNRTSLPEALGDAAILVDPTDHSAMASAMLRVLSDNSLATERREKGLQRAATFTPKRQAERTLRLYEELLL